MQTVVSCLWVVKMNKLNNVSGRIFLDVIAAMYIMVMISVLVFNTIFFNIKMLHSIESTDKISCAINDEMSILLAKKQYQNTDIEGMKISYSKLYAGNIDGTDFYKFIIDISQERSGIKRSYEILISE